MSLRGKSLEDAARWSELVLRMCDELGQAINDSWQMDDLNDMMLGFSEATNSDASSQDKATAVESIKSGIKGIKRLLDESGEIEAMLEAQTASARMVATMTVEQLEKAQADLAASEERLEAEASFVSAVKAQAAGKAARLKKLETEADNATAKLAWATTALDNLRGEHAAATKDLAGDKRKEERERKLAQEKVAGLQEAHSAQAAKSLREWQAKLAAAVNAERSGWASKYAALEAEYAALEPRYKEIVDNQRGRIRVLEKELATSAASAHRPVSPTALDDAEKMQTLTVELRSMAAQLADACARNEYLESTASTAREAAAELQAASNQTTAELKGLKKAGWLQEQKLTEMERGLVDTIGQRKAAEVALAAERVATASIEAAHAEETATLDAQRAVAATLLEQVSRLAGLRTATLRRDVADTGFGFQVADGPTSGAVVSEIKPDSVAAGAGTLFVGDLIVAINGTPMLAGPRQSVVTAISTGGNTVELLLAGDDDSDDDGDDSDAGTDTDSGADGSEGEARRGGALPLAVLIDMRSARPGLAVRIQAALTHQSAPFYFNAVDNDGMVGTISQVFPEDETCQVQFPEDETCRVPVGTLVYIPDGLDWEHWTKARVPESPTKQLPAGLRISPTDDLLLADSDVELEADLMDRIAAAVSAEPTGMGNANASDDGTGGRAFAERATSPAPAKTRVYGDIL